MALNRFLHLKRRLSSTPERWLRYKEEIEEYFILQQIAPAVDRESGSHGMVRGSDIKRQIVYCVLPHHAIFKEELHTTKQRIVFDASAMEGRYIMFCIQD